MYLIHININQTAFKMKCNKFSFIKHCNAFHFFFSKRQYCNCKRRWCFVQMQRQRNSAIRMDREEAYLMHAGRITRGEDMGAFQPKSQLLWAIVTISKNVNSPNGLCSICFRLQIITTEASCTSYKINNWMDGWMWFYVTVELVVFFTFWILFQQRDSENVFSCWAQAANGYLEDFVWLFQWSLQTPLSWEEYFNQTVIPTKCPGFLIRGNVKQLKQMEGDPFMFYLPHTAQRHNFSPFSVQCSLLTNPLHSQASIVRPIRGRGALETHTAMCLHISV